MISSNPNYLPKAPRSNTITLEVMASIYEMGLGGHKHSYYSSPQYIFDEEMKENPQIVLTVLIKEKYKERQIFERRLGRRSVTMMTRKVDEIYGPLELGGFGIKMQIKQIIDLNHKFIFPMKLFKGL